MNPFSILLDDTVYLEDNAGERSGPYKTAIGSKNGLFAPIFEAKLDVQEGWKLIRILPNDKEERYTILEANFSPGLDAIPPHWTLKLRKDSSLVKPRTEQRTTTINIRNSQGIRIGDHNIQHIANSLSGLVEMIESADAKPDEKKEAKGLLRKFLSNPLVAAVLGGATSNLLALLA